MSFLQFEQFKIIDSSGNGGDCGVVWQWCVHIILHRFKQKQTLFDFSERQKTLFDVFIVNNFRFATN